MIDNLIYYTCGALVVSNIIVIWNITELPVHFFDIFSLLKKKSKREKLYTRGDWEQHVSLNWGYLGELLMCPLCLSTHISWIVGLCIFFITQCDPWLILLGTFSWPLIAYSFYKKLS
jgi:hypothetical protein